MNKLSPFPKAPPWAYMGFGCLMALVGIAQWRLVAPPNLGNGMVSFILGALIFLGGVVELTQKRKSETTNN
jgi:hypothetical protein